MRVPKKWFVYILVSTLSIALMVVALHQTGKDKISVWVWHALLGLEDAIPPDSIVHYAYPIEETGLIMGCLQLKSFEFGEYSDVEIIGVYFYRGLREDIPARGEIPTGVLNQLRPVEGSRLAQSQDGVKDWIVLSLKVSGQRPSGPFSGKVIYKRFGFRYMQGFYPRQ